MRIPIKNKGWLRIWVLYSIIWIVAFIAIGLSGFYLSYQANIYVKNYSPNRYTAEIENIKTRLNKSNYEWFTLLKSIQNIKDKIELQNAYKKLDDLRKSEKEDQMLLSEYYGIQKLSFENFERNSRDKNVNMIYGIYSLISAVLGPLLFLSVYNIVLWVRSGFRQG